MSEGIEKSIFYFKSEGKKNISKTVDLVIERAISLSIKNIIVFTSDGEGAFLIKDKLPTDSTIQIHAATFPYKQIFHDQQSDGSVKEFHAKTSDIDIKEKMKKNAINLIQGVMPLQDIILPGIRDVKTQSISYTLSLFSNGLKLCVQAILMATDGGHIEPKESVIAMSADTAIVARSSRTSWLFHPLEGLQINEIICKPSELTLKLDR